jgi:hypothetical protein
MESFRNSISLKLPDNLILSEFAEGEGDVRAGKRSVAETSPEVKVLYSIRASWTGSFVLAHFLCANRTRLRWKCSGSLPDLTIDNAQLRQARAGAGEFKPVSRPTSA